MELLLPEFNCTEDAVRYGLQITRDQFIMIAGARAALQREFGKVEDFSCVNTRQYQVELATRIQLYRECLDSAPFLVLASLIGSGLAINTAIINSKTRHSSQVTRHFSMSPTGV